MSKILLKKNGDVFKITDMVRFMTILCDLRFEKYSGEVIGNNKEIYAAVLFVWFSYKNVEVEL